MPSTNSPNSAADDRLDQIADAVFDVYTRGRAMGAGLVCLAPMLRDGTPNFDISGLGELSPEPHPTTMSLADIDRLCLVTGLDVSGRKSGYEGTVVLTRFHPDSGKAMHAQIAGPPGEFAAAVTALDRAIAGKPLQEAPEPARPVAANDNRKPIHATPFVLRDPRQIPMREWLFGSHYIRRYLSLTVGAGGGGKSSNAVPEALAMVTGRPLLGGMPAKPLRVWYVNLEDPAVEIERRFGAAIKHYGLGAAHIGDRLYIDSGRDQQFVVLKQLGRDVQVVEPTVAGMISEIKARQIDVVVVDPFVSTHQVPENDNSLIQRVAEQWTRIADEADCSVELVHHVRKSSEEVTADDARGGGALKDKARSLRTINPMSEQEAARAGVNADERLDYFRVDLGKANMQRRGNRSEWRHFVSVNLGNGRGNLNPGDNVGVVEAWSWPSADDLVEGVTPDQLDRIKLSIGRNNYRENAQANDWAGHIVAEVLGLESDDMAIKKRIATMLTAWTKAGHFEVVTDHDLITRKTKKFIRAKAASPSIW